MKPTPTPEQIGKAMLVWINVPGLQPRHIELIGYFYEAIAHSVERYEQVKRWVADDDTQHLNLREAVAIARYHNFLKTWDGIEPNAPVN